MAETKPVTKKKPRKERLKLKGNNVKKYMLEQDMCSQELADITGISPPHICRIIKEQKKCVSLPIALIMGKALNTPVEKLFYM